jgi:hypothetical protein
LALEHVAQAANDLVPTNKKMEMCKRASKQVLAAEPGPLAATDKKVKPDTPVLAVATPTQGVWCPIHEINSHDLKTTSVVLSIANNSERDLVIPCML